MARRRGYTPQQHRAWLEKQRARDFGPSKPLVGREFFLSFLRRQGELGREAAAARNRGLPRVRIGSAIAQARRRSINRTRTSQEHKISMTSGSGAYIPELYGLCSPKPHLFAPGMDGNDFIFGIWYGFGEIEEFTEILINDAAVPGAVTTEEHKGTSTQTASTILSNLSGYTDTLVIDVNGTDRGVAYLAFRVPPGAVSGFPKVTVKIKGNCDIEDTRGPTTAYSDLPALCFRHWLKTTGVGPEFSVNDSTFETLATFNEEVPGDAWLASYNYSVGGFAVPTGANTKFRIYEVTADAGSSGASEPSPWNDTLGATTTDSGITWTCRDGRRHVCGMVMDVKADVDSWIETWRTACGGMVHFGESGVEVIPDKARATDHTFLHASGEILESPALQLRQTCLKDRATSVEVIYTNTSGKPWRDGTDVRVAASGVDAGTTPDRPSVIYAPWIQRKAQAVRLATERLNASSLTDLSFQLNVFDEGLKVTAGDIVEVTHPLMGAATKKMRVLDAYAMAPGRWTLDLWEYDPAVYSDYVESEPTYVDFGLNAAQDIPRVFTATPTTPYAIRDIWVNGPAGEMKRCSTARTSGAYQSGDWELASKYDKTSEHDCQNPGDYTASHDCQNPGDYTASHTSNSTSYLDGSENRTTDAAVEIKKDLKMMGGVDISFYNASAAYVGGIYGSGDYLKIDSNSDLILSGGGTAYCAMSFYPSSDGNLNLGHAFNQWQNLHLSNILHASKIDRGYSTSGRLKVYDKNTGVLIEEYRYSFTT